MSKQQLSLGFAVGSAELVTIPLGHMAVVGVTQRSGKTTTLDALAHRVPDDVCVLAFVTKRGEDGFNLAGMQYGTHRPYFRERADWQFVEAILEATLRERMKFERGWIMKVSRGAIKLRDVWANVKREREKARGQFAQDQYDKLDAYFELVVPQLADVQWASTLALATGLNIMDLGELSSEVQSLVIASCLDFVLHQRMDTVVIVPEAWEFIPRGRKSPVTLSAESYVRKGAALRNYLWIDSQDLAGVHTPVLKSLHVTLLGVQREINEIKRTLAHVHGVPKKPKPDDIAGLGLGQFYACWEGHAVKTYVQPAWLNDTIARVVAKTGNVQMVTTGRVTQQALMPPRPGPIITGITGPGEDDEMDTQLKQENDRLNTQVTELLQTVHTLQNQLAQVMTKIPKTELASWGATEAAPNGVPPAPSADPQPTARVQASPAPGMQPTLDQFYDYVVKRLLADGQMVAAVMKIKTARPSLVVDVAPRVISLDGASLKGRMGRLIQNGFLNEPKIAADMQRELQRTGAAIHAANLGRALNDFVEDGFLVREGTGYQKPADLQVTLNVLTAI